MLGIMKQTALVVVLAALAPAPAFASQEAEERGAKVFRKCKSCHRVGDEARHGVGPHLNGVFGRRAGSLDGFDYSEDMVRMGIDGLVWDHEKLDIYLENPKNLVSRTRMNFRGLKAAEDRADIMAFLRRFSDDPSDIPEGAPTVPSSDPVVDASILAIEGDPAYGEYLSSECVTCHRADGADEGIPSIVGWPEEDFVVALHAYRAEYRDNPAMRLVASQLSDEEIAGLAAYFGGLR